MLDSIPSFARLTAELAKLPGIGRRTATRLVLNLLRRPEADVETLAAALLALRRNVRYCSRCFGLTEDDPCALCRDTRREAQLLCVVEQPQDLLAIERSRSFRGYYHVLHGALSPLDGIGPEQLRLAELWTRLREGEVSEVVVATNFSVEGEATALYLAEQIRPLGVAVTRLAYGIPLGSDLEFVDEATVNRAVLGRRSL